MRLAEPLPRRSASIWRVNEHAAGENTMSTTGDPIRLRRTTAPGSLLRQGLEAAQSAGPSDEELMALRQGVLGLGAAAATAVGAQALKAKGAAATGWLSAGSTKMVAVLAALALGGGGFAVFRAAGKHAQGRVTPSGALRERAAPNGISAEAPAEAPALPAVLESPTQTLPTERAKGARKLARPSIGLSSSGAVEDEVPLLERANRALASAPTQALALTNERSNLASCRRHAVARSRWARGQ